MSGSIVSDTGHPLLQFSVSDDGQHLVRDWAVLHTRCARHHLLLPVCTMLS